MERRNAWRLLDFTKDVFMHHRKFTPFQKIVFLSFFVGVLLCLFRNGWFLVLTFTYGLTVYTSIVVSEYIIKSKAHFSSDLVLNWIECAEAYVAGLSPSHCVTNSSDKIYTSQNTERVNENEEFFDATDNLQESSVTTAVSSAKKDNFENVVGDLTSFIHRDFIKSWYSLFSKDEDGLAEAEQILHNICDNVQGRLCRANVLKIAKYIILMFRNHVHEVKQAQMMFKLQKRRRRSSVKPLLKTETQNIQYKSVEDCYGSKIDLHPAVRSMEHGQAYQKSILELLVLHLLPRDLYDSKSVVCALKEIVMCNVLQTIMSLLCDATFLHERIIVITSDEQPSVCIENTPIICVTESNTVEDVQSILVQKTASRESADKNTVTVPDIKKTKEAETDSRKRSESTDTIFYDTKWNEDTKLHPVSKGLCNECNRLCSNDKDRISPRPHTCSVGTKPAYFEPDRLSLNSQSSREGSPVFQLHDELEKLDSDRLSISSISDIPAKSHIPDSIKTQTDHVAGSVGLLEDVFHSDSNSATIVQSQDHGEEQGRTFESAKEVTENTQIEDKSSSNTFFNMNFQIPNPLTSISNFRKKSSTASLIERKKSDSNLEHIGETGHENTDIRRSLSSGVIKQENVSPTGLVDVTPWPTSGPCVFQDVTIVDTETAVEAGGTSRYTLYKLEYEALYQSDNSELVHKTGTVKRRFREFVNLQSRLEDNPVYKKSMRDVKGPKRILPPFPFGNMGKETLDNRRKLLETFVASLLKKEDICNGEELKQFLGYKGDGHIAFVRKMSESSGPRIDQRLVKTVSGVFDRIVEGLPSLPQQMPRIITPFDDQRTDKEEEVKHLKDTDAVQVEFVFDHVQTLSQRSENSLDKFIEIKTCDLDLEDQTESQNNTTLGTSILAWQDLQGTSHSNKMTRSGHMISSSHLTVGEEADKEMESSQSQDEGPSASEECELSSAVLDILTELLHGEDNWVCRDNVIRTAKIVFGKGLNRYLQTKIEFLTSREMNTFYVKTLRDIVWPGGTLSEETRQPFTDHQREVIRKQAKRCLGEFLPGVLKTLLGQDDFDHILEEVMETIQYEKLNRHFWYTAFDVILEQLVPEISSPEFQRKLSASVEK